MTCGDCRRTLLDAALGEDSPELEAHLSECAPCHAALASERDLLGRIDAELQESMAVEPSPAFLPVVRRRVAELRTGSEGVRVPWLWPAVATLAGVLVIGSLVSDGRRGPVTSVSPATGPDAPSPARATERVGPGSSRLVAAPATEVRSEAATSRARPSNMPATQASPETPVPDRTAHVRSAASSRPRVFVPAEDERAVRRLARRLRGRAARAAVLTPESREPFDFTLAPVGEPTERVSFWGPARGAEPGFAEPPSFDQTFETAGRET